MNTKTLVAMILTPVLFAGGLAFQAGRAGPPQPVIATVNLEDALQGLAERASKEEELKSKFTTAKSAAEARKAEVEQKTKDLNILPEGLEKKAAAEQLRKMVFSAEFEAQFAQRTLNETQGDLLRELYNKIEDASARLAKKSGYTMVISSDASVKIPAANAQDVTRVISLKRMLFVDPAHDITGELVTMMNNEFSAAGSRGAGGAPAPAAKTAAPGGPGARK